MMQIPSIGLGTYQMTERDVRNALPFAIKECKYRLIDTAAGYKNEQFIGNEITSLIGEGAIVREDLFITSKLSNLHWLIGDRYKRSRI